MKTRLVISTLLALALMNGTTATAQTGEAVYNKACVACHTAGVAGAPKIGDKAAWEPRMAQGLDALVTSSLKGKGAMPPKGGNASLSDAEVKSAVEYMLQKAGLMEASASAAATAPAQAAAPEQAPAPEQTAAAAPAVEPAAGPGDAAAGKAKAEPCAACHGADGNSTNPEWPKLAGQHAGYTSKQLRDFKDGKTRNNAMMTGMVAALSPQDMADLGAFFASQTTTSGFTSEARLETGQRLYRGGNQETGVPACTACHGATGAGDPLGGVPSLSGQHATYIAAQLRAFRTGARSNDDNSMMRDAVKLMSPDEIDSVAEYVSGLH